MIGVGWKRRCFQSSGESEALVLDLSESSHLLITSVKFLKSQNTHVILDSPNELIVNENLIKPVKVKLKPV